MPLRRQALRAASSTSGSCKLVDPRRRRLRLRLQPALPAERVHLPLLRRHRGHLRRRQRRGHHRRPLLEAGHDGRGLVGHDRRAWSRPSAASSSARSIPTSPINGQMFWGLAMASSSRRLCRRLAPDQPGTDLRHGPDAPPRDLPDPGGVHRSSTRCPIKGWKVLGMGREFTPLRQGHLHRHLRLDAVLGRRLRRRHGPQPDRGRSATASWMAFWKTYVDDLSRDVSIVVIVWFSAGRLHQPEGR